MNEKAGGIAAGAVLLLGAILPMPDRLGQILRVPTLCPFHTMTGLPCPFCGMTRAVVCAMHGHFSQSFAYHPLGIPFCIGLAIWLAFLTAKMVMPGFKLSILSQRQITPAWAILAAVVIIAWIIRLCGIDPLPS